MAAPSTEVTPVKRGDIVTPGVRYYEVKSILVLNATDKGQLWDVKFVPNFNRGYAVRFSAFLAKNDFKIALNENGGPKQHGIDTRYDRGD
jgi:hypothetical protein